MAKIFTRPKHDATQKLNRSLRVRATLVMIGVWFASLGIANVRAQDAVMSEALEAVGEVDFSEDQESKNEPRTYGLAKQLLNQKQLDELLQKAPIAGDTNLNRNPLRMLRALPTPGTQEIARGAGSARRQLETGSDREFTGRFGSRPTVDTQKSAWRRDTAVRRASFEEPAKQDEVAESGTSGFVVNRKQEADRTAPVQTPIQNPVDETPPVAPATPATSLNELEKQPQSVAVADPPLDPEPAIEPAATPPAEEAFIGPQVPAELMQRWKAGDDLVQMTGDELLKKIQQRKQEIESLPNAEDATNQQRLQKIATAVEAIAIANQNVSEVSKKQRQITDLEPEIEVLNRRLNAAPNALAVDVSLGVEQLQSVLKNLEAELDETTADVSRVQDLIEKRDQRMARIPVERIEYRKQLDELHEKIQQEKSRGMDDLTTLYALRAQELQALTAVTLLDQESKWYGLSRSLLPLRRDVQLKDIRSLELEVVKWSEAIDLGRRRELEEQVRIATNNAYNSEPSLKAFNEKTIDITSSRKTLQAKLSEVQKEKILVSAQGKDLKQQISSIESAINVGSNASGGTLINVHQTLVRPYEGMSRVQHLKRELQDSKIAILTLRQQREQFGDIEGFITEKLGIANDVAIPKTNKTLKAMAREAIELRKQQIDALSGENEMYRDRLIALISERESVLAQIALTRQLVETHALWTQSATPVGVEVMMEAKLGARKFFAPRQWQQLAGGIVGRMRTRPYESVVGLLGLLIAFVVGRKLKN